jgi:hydroxyacylglutathione hydrolase
MDRIAGYLSGGIAEWAMTGKDFNTAPLISARDMKNIKNGYDHVCLVDIRTPQEYEQGHLSGTVNVPVQELRSRYVELNAEHHLILLCSTGFRSSLAASILKQKGFKKISHLAGGMTGYGAAQ